MADRMEMVMRAATEMVVHPEKFGGEVTWKQAAQMAHNLYEAVRDEDVRRRENKRETFEGEGD